VKWEYDPGTNSFLRSIGQEAHVDLNIGSQIEANNVIIEVVETRVIDSEGRLHMELAGRGEAIVFSRGQVTRGRWIRDSSPREPAVYVSETGDSIQLRPRHYLGASCSDANRGRNQFCVEATRGVDVSVGECHSHRCGTDQEIRY